jgi:thioesterase domain-containing protein
MNTAADLEAYLHRHIPLSRAMQVQVVQYDGASLRLAAPLEPNHNDKGTAFAGSIGGLASLAGWGLMMLWSQPLGPCHVAIAHADIQYRRPLRGVFQATAHLPAEAETVRFHHAFQERGRGKLPVRIEVGDEQGAGVVQNAVYAVWRIEPPVV